MLSWIMSEEAEMLETISEAQLQKYCGDQDSNKVTNIEMKVDSCQFDLSSVGIYLTNLRHLKLSGSSIHWIRDLGSSLKVLEVLWLCHCHLQDLQGISAMQNLKELYVAFNDVAETAPLHWHESLEVVDLEGNCLQDMDDLLEMSTCESLRELNISSNPVCKLEGFSRSSLSKAMPHLEVLDDIAVDDIISASTEAMTDSPGPLDSQLDDLFASLRQLDEAMELDTSDRSKSARDTAESEMDSDCANPCAHTPCTQSAMLAAMTSPEDWAQATALLKSDPDEEELIVESVKSSGSRMSSSSPAMDMVMQKAGRFHFQLASRTSGALNTALGAESIYENDASDLTRGDCLTGSPLRAARQSRLRKSQHGSHGLDIRSLLRLYRTYEQPSCLSEEEIEARRSQVEQCRPSTPDVRVRPQGEVRTHETQQLRMSADGTLVTPVKKQQATAGTSNCTKCSQSLTSSEVVPDPRSLNPNHCISKMLPAPPPGPYSGKNGPFRRVCGKRGCDASSVGAGCDSIAMPYDNVACRLGHDITKSKEAGVRKQSREGFIDVIPPLKEEKRRLISPAKEQKKTEQELSPAEAQMMTSMLKLVQEAPRFY
eukprot:gnl/MRDRNA2_/MRDRNA2_29976_c0_seq1.p1 gnl/MRDRNA2_/MRDRNA2_29976_c0~~gnl/MRDRNA2_/MRDRNA2_29976_c0_seq1.p1  ORF type:complete len:598 (+),score=123.28 gnl/MRDRNA2_/MRDRNA2_29976_c0_seq1:96-1889(+)